jgi:hypothetical protein
MILQAHFRTEDHRSSRKWCRSSVRLYVVFRHPMTRTACSTTGILTIATEMRGRNAQRSLLELKSERNLELRSHAIMQ